MYRKITCVRTVANEPGFKAFLKPLHLFSMQWPVCLAVMFTLLTNKSLHLILSILSFVLQTGFCIKGTVHPRIKNVYFSLLPRVPFIHLDCFGASCPVWKISISSRNVSLKYNDPRWHLACGAENAKKHIVNLKTQQQCILPEIITQLFKIIHKPCCELFCVRAIFL